MFSTYKQNIILYNISLRCALYESYKIKKNQCIKFNVFIQNTILIEYLI